MGIGKVAKPAIFLDRDGVINALVLNPSTGRMESPLTVTEFRLLDGVLPALLRLRRAGYSLSLVSNQPNYALGKSTLRNLGAIHYRLVSELLAAGIQFTRFYYCLHHPQGIRSGYSGPCVCRKPSPWFLLRARDEFGYSLRDCWMIGDLPTDMECGKAAGARTIRLTSGSRPTAPEPAGPLADPHADYCARDLAAAVDIILTRPGG